MGTVEAFQVGVNQQWIQVAQYDTNVNDGNIDVYVSAGGGYSNKVTLSFTIVPYQQNTQPWGTASGGYTPASVVFSTVDRATGQTLSSTAVVAPGGQTVTLTPPDVVQINIIPSTDPSQATANQNTWQMIITGTDPNGITSTATVTILVQLGCPYLYGVAFNNATVTTVDTGTDAAVLNDSNQGRLFFVNGIYWLFSVFNYTESGMAFKDIQWFTSTDGFDWNVQTNPQPRFGRLGFSVPGAVYDNFWDCEYDPSIASFVFAVAQGIRSTEVDFVVATPDNAGNLSVGYIDGDISSFTVSNADPVAGVGIPSVISNGTHNVWTTISYEDLDGYAHVDTWNYTGSWSTKRTDTFGRGQTHKGMPFFFSSYSSVAVIEGALFGSKLSAYLTNDGGNTWASAGSTVNSYYISYGNGIAVPFGAPIGPTVNLAMPDTAGKVRFVTLTSNGYGGAYFIAEPIIGSGYNTANLTMRNDQNLYVVMANTNTVALSGSSDFGTTWTSPQIVTNAESGIQFGSLHSTSSTFLDPSSNHLSLDAVWTDYNGTVASIRNSPVDLSKWPSIPTATAINSVIVPHGTSRPLNGFVYPIGAKTSSASATNREIVISYPNNGDYYGVTATFSNGSGVQSIPAPVSVDNPTPFNIEISAPATAPTGLSFPFTTILIISASDSLSGATSACYAASSGVIVVTVT